MVKNVIISMGLIFLLASGMKSQSSMYIGPQLGYQQSSDADNGKYMGGLALRMKLNRAIGIEGSINYRSEAYNNGAVTVRSWPVMVTGLFYPVQIAYGAIGAGWYNTSFSYDPTVFPGSSDETKQEFGWHFGGGLEIPLGTSSMFTADIRYVFLNYNFKSVPGSSAANSDFYMLTFGYLFQL